MHPACFDSFWRFPNPQVSQSPRRSMDEFLFQIRLLLHPAVFQCHTAALASTCASATLFFPTLSYLSLHAEQSPPATAAALLLHSGIPSKLRGSLQDHAGCSSLWFIPAPATLGVLGSLSGVTSVWILRRTHTGIL